MKISKQKIIFIGTIFIFISVFSAALVVNSANVDVSCSKYQYPWCQEATGGPAGLVNQIYRIAFGLAAACALGVLIYGAISWTLSGAVSSKQDALEWIKAALWGLMLLLAAFIILYTINPDLVINISSGLDKSIKQVPKSSGSGGVQQSAQQFNQQTGLQQFNQQIEQFNQNSGINNLQLPQFQPISQ